VEWNVPMSAVAPVLAAYDDLNELVNAIINTRLRPATKSGYEAIFAELLRGEHVILLYDPYIYDEMLRDYFDKMRYGEFRGRGAPEYVPFGSPPSPVNVNIMPAATETGKFRGYNVVLNHESSEQWYRWAYDLPPKTGGVEVLVAAGPKSDLLLDMLPRTARKDLDNEYNVWELEMDRHMFELILEKRLSVMCRAPLIDPAILTPIFP
jgi:hypothetical protein